MRKICILTGTRAEYGVLKPIIKAVDNNPLLELSLVVTGMHLSQEFGYSFDEIKNDGFKIEGIVDMNPEDDTGISMAKSVGKGITGLSDVFEKIKPDILLIIGDRIEALAAAVAAAYMNIIIAHISGGDVTRAGLDESVRHSITKLSHIHFPSTRTSESRVLKMGEDKWRVFRVGAPCLDTILYERFLSRDELNKKFNLEKNEDFIVLLQHSVTTQVEHAENQIKETLEAIKELKIQTIAIYPNSDAGGRKIISKIKEYEKLPFIKSYKNLHQKDYFSLLKHARALVGNSSSGIIESSSFKLPVVNIGIRQEGRERANNVIDAEHKKDKIIQAIKKAFSEEFKKKLNYCVSPYGDGKTSQRITKVLSEIDLNDNLLQKKIAY
ncbi:MAG: UDP-N-acetylglucosamine 2-epimerase [Candidatus Nanoarchaeia archaeon]|nr:UDP-N-acetylglucosamine 2-epimerase [Candidatus Nanoarchaeia archaeon]